MSLLTGGVFCLQCRRLALTLSVRNYRWKQPTFYDILRIHPEATQAEVKEAYLKLSKEYHPDMNQNVTKQDKELIHAQYVKINEAYSVLGKESQRRHYDAQIFVKIDPEQFQGGGEKRKSPRSEAMTFEERAKAYGFKPQVGDKSDDLSFKLLVQDPNFYEKHGNYHKKIVLACIAWILFGSIISSGSIFSMYWKHSSELEVANNKNSEVLMTSRNNARIYGTLEAQKEALAKRWEEEQRRHEASREN